MKAIVLHGACPDNTGSMHAAGDTLTVSDEAKAGCISEAKAKHLVKIHSAKAAG
jgi:hypothetical protein